VVRELRRLFGLYELLNKQIRQLKNQIHGVLLDNGVRDRALGKRMADNPARAQEWLREVELSAASRLCIQSSLVLLVGLQEQKEGLKREIYHAGRTLEAEVKLLISIRGITPLLAVVFLAEVGDIRRFTSARKLHSYLGVVPTVRSSGGMTRGGAINRRSRALSRSLFTQIAIHLVNSSPVVGRFYRELSHRKGYGRARIALLRKTFSMMRRMLLSRQPYRWTETTLYKRKLEEYRSEIERGDHQQVA
jgi:transposase